MIPGPVLFRLDPAVEFIHRSCEIGHVRLHLRNLLARGLDALLPHAMLSLDGPAVLSGTLARTGRALEHRRDTELRLDLDPLILAHFAREEHLQGPSSKNAAKRSSV
jgi:hypothetical protein